MTTVAYLVARNTGGKEADAINLAQQIRDLCADKQCLEIELGNMIVNSDYTKSNDVNQQILCDNDCKRTYLKGSVSEKDDNEFMSTLNTKLSDMPVKDFKPNQTYSGKNEIKLSNFEDIKAAKITFIPSNISKYNVIPQATICTEGPISKTIQGTKVEKCVELCDSTPACTHFNRNDETEQCWFSRQRSIDCNTTEDPKRENRSSYALRNIDYLSFFDEHKQN